MTQPDEVHSEFERRLLEQYRAAADESPPAALDRAVLDNARRAAAETPRAARASAGAAGPAGPAPRFAADVNDAPRQRREEQRWGRPLALAAALVLGIGIVVRYEMVSPDLSPPGEDKVAAASAPASVPPPADAPAQPAAAGSAANADAKPAPPATPSVAPSVASSVPSSVAPPAAAAPPAAEPAPAASAKDSAPAPVATPAPKQEAPAEAETAKRRAQPEQREKKAAPASAPAGGRVDSVMRDNLAREETDRKIREQASAELQKAEIAGKPQAASSGALAPDQFGGGDKSARSRAYASGNAAAPALAAPPPPPAPARAAPAPAPAPSAPAAADAPIDAAATPRVPFYEGDPDLWARRIIELRRAGRNQSADADLRRLRARYPDFKVPAEALPAAPPATPATPP